MSNKKKLKSRNGATRITPDKYTGEFCGLFKLQVYDKAGDAWDDLEGCDRLTWKEAAQARKNYVALRAACKVANNGVIKLHVPNEGNGN